MIIIGRSTKKVIDMKSESNRNISLIGVTSIDKLVESLSYLPPTIASKESESFLWVLSIPSKTKKFCTR